MEKVKEGDAAVLYFTRNETYEIHIKEESKLNTRYGTVNGLQLIDIEYYKEFELLGTKAYIMKQSGRNIIQTKGRRTQILFEQDIGLIIYFLNLKSGSRVVECGTGSGILTYFLSKSVSSTGAIYTYEIDVERYNKFKQDILDYKLTNVTSHLKDCEKNGFIEEYVDAVFLDMPSPENSINAAHVSLKSGGRICVFLPSFGQVISAVNEMRKLFCELEMFENVMREYSNSKQGPGDIDDVHVASSQYLHTGYMIFGVK